MARSDEYKSQAEGRHILVRLDNPFMLTELSIVVLSWEIGVYDSQAPWRGRICLKETTVIFRYYEDIVHLPLVAVHYIFNNSSDQEEDLYEDSSDQEEFFDEDSCGLEEYLRLFDESDQEEDLGEDDNDQDDSDDGWV
nr:hypothetical protein [Tanacetum cinerariifolium]